MGFEKTFLYLASFEKDQSTKIKLSKKIWAHVGYMVNGTTVSTIGLLAALSGSYRRDSFYRFLNDSFSQLLQISLRVSAHDLVDICVYMQNNFWDNETKIFSEISYSIWHKKISQLPQLLVQILHHKRTINVMKMGEK